MFLAQRWFDGSSESSPCYRGLGHPIGFADEMRQSARILFDSTVILLSDEDSSVLVEKLQHNRMKPASYDVPPSDRATNSPLSPTFRRT
jgi:hypothetical protein